MGPISLNDFASFVDDARSAGLKQNQRVVLCKGDSLTTDEKTLDEQDTLTTGKKTTDPKNLKIVAGKQDFPEARYSVVDTVGWCQAAENNQIRQKLINALTDHYNVKTVLELPKSIRKALKFRLLTEDMRIDKEGRVTSGRPLTLRRIKAVLAAVKKEGLKSENKVFNCKEGGCVDYRLFDVSDDNNRSFKNLVDTYFEAPNLDALPNFFKMLADAASFLTKKGDRKMLGGSYNNLKQLKKDVSELEGSMVGLEMSDTIEQMRDLIKNGYAKWNEDTRKGAIWNLMAGSEYTSSQNAHEIDGLRNMLRFGDTHGRPESMTDQELATRLTGIRTKLDTAWRKADSMGASLEQQLANDMLRYVIDFWLKDEVKG